MGAIPKNLFDPDIRPIIAAKNVLKRGGRILLFPEGRCTVGGSYMGVHKSTGKLIKNLGVTVISCHIEGSYTCMPFWRNGLRLGNERITIADLFSAEDTAELSVDKINTALDTRLSGYDTKPIKKPFHTYGSKRLTQGLQNILYWCPKCGCEFTLKADDCKILCTSCGNTATLDRYARFTPASGSIAPGTVQLWYQEQAKYEKSKLCEDMIPLSIAVAVRMPVEGHDGITPCGSGTLQLSPDGWRYIGSLSGKDVSLFFPIATVPALPFDPNDNFQIYSKGTFFAFTPEDGRLCSKFATIGECAYWRFAEKVQMTAGCDSGF